MSTTEMPEQICSILRADCDGKWVKGGVWSDWSLWGDDGTSYTRTDLVEAERAECVEVLRAFVKWHEEGMSRFSPEYRAEALGKGALVEFGGVPLTSQPFRDAAALLSKLEAKS